MNSVLKFFFCIYGLIILLSCNSEVGVTLHDSRKPIVPINQLHLNSLNISSSDYSRDVYLVTPFVGDDNNDAVVTLYYCSIKKKTGCNPFDGESVVLDKSGKELIGFVNIPLSSELTSGDIMKYQLVSIDSDGVVGGTDHGYLLIPHDDSELRSVRQLGMFSIGSGKLDLDATGDDDFYTSIVAKDGSIYMAGKTESNLGEHNGGTDAVIVKLTPTGELDSKFGTDGIVQLGIISSNGGGDESISSLALDKNGNLYAGGSTSGSLSGANAGSNDGIILKLNAETGKLDEEFGDGDGVDNDGIVQINAFNIATGSSASSSDSITAIILDGNGNLFAAGSTASSLSGANAGSSDAFVLKMNTSTGILDSNFGDGDGEDNDGIVQINIATGAGANSSESISAIVLDESGNIFVAGSSWGSMSGTNAGGYDGFIIKMNSNSGVLDSSFGNGDGEDNDGIVQINASNIAAGSDASGHDSISSIALDNAGNLFATGSTTEQLSGAKGGIAHADIFVLKMNTNSGLLDSTFGNGDGEDNDGIVQINSNNIAAGSSAGHNDYGESIIVDGSGNIFVGGSTVSSISNSNAGGWSGYILKLNGSTGLLDNSFGDGDGEDNDGIVQINALNIAPESDVSSTEYLKSINLDPLGNLIAVGYTNSVLSGANSGGYDGFVIKINSNSGVLVNDFGHNDGRVNDGIFQLNITQESKVSASKSESIKAMVLDGLGNLYAAGNTTSSLSGKNAGYSDIFVMKMDARSGKLDLEFGDGDGVDNDGIVQISSLNIAAGSSATGPDTATSVVIDSSGNLYIAGLTRSSLSGANAGWDDAIIIKMDANSGLLDNEFGDGDGSDNDGIVQMNSTYLPVGADATNTDSISSIVVDNLGNLYVGGSTSRTFSGVSAGQNDAFILKIDTDSGLLDTTFGDGDGNDNDGIVQINASSIAIGASANLSEGITSIALDGLGNLFAAGSTSSDLSGSNSGGRDSFILKMNTSTGVLDSNFGDGDGRDNDGIVIINNTYLISGNAGSSDGIESMLLDGLGNIYVVGDTRGALSGTNSGWTDGFVLKLDANTGVLDTSFGDGDGSNNDGIVQINNTYLAAGSNSNDWDRLYAVGIDGLGNLYVAGETESPLSASNSGNEDGFILKMDANSGLPDTSFGNGDGEDNDGILQLNNSSLALGMSAQGVESLNTLAVDSFNNVFIGGGTSSSLGERNVGEEDIYTIMIGVGEDGIN